MHHAYPLECPYPHLSGTTKPVTARTFMEETGESVEVTHDEIRDLLNRSSSSQEDSVADESAANELPWSTEEELFVCRSDSSKEEGTRNVFVRAFRGAVPAIAALSVAFALVRVQTGNDKQGSHIPDKKFYV